MVHRTPSRLVAYGWIDSPAPWSRYFWVALCSTTLLGRTTGQVVLNGSFENTTATENQINLVNGAYNDLMPDSYGFGDYNGGGDGGGNLDIIITDVYCGPAQHGDWYVALTSGGTDAFSLTLSSPLQAGTTYALEFYDRTCADISMGSPVEIGVSTSPDAFGTPIGILAAPVSAVWTQRVITFAAPFAGGYITVRCTGENSGSPWTQVDHFRFLGGATGVAGQMVPEFRVFPNPADDQLWISGLDGLAHELKLVDALGRCMRVQWTKAASAVLDVRDLAIGRYVLLLDGERAATPVLSR